jgi:membrane-bound acyltransferase YfiQ involved in biofilm formation
MTPSVEPNERSWKYRRRLSFTTVILSFLILGYLIVFGEDNQLNRDIAGTIGFVMAVTIAGYIGGATADDALKDKYRK